MGKRVYLDNCCFNRPYDDQSQTRISLEAEAKLKIQDMIKNNEIELVGSYVLDYENSANPYDNRKSTIGDFVKNYAKFYVGEKARDEIIKSASDIMATGVKEVDASHIACAKKANCDYFLTTDDRVLKYKDENVVIANPIDFISKEESND